MERDIIYLRIPDFPVAVERVVRPELRGRPVVVAPLGASRSVVAALSAEAWSAGIRKGMALAQAVRYCRDAVILPPNEPLYCRASRAVFRVMETFTPLLEPAGHGHAYLDVTGTGKLFGPRRDMAWKAQLEIRRQLRLSSCFGIASNKMVSRIATEAGAQPAGLQDVPSGGESSFLSPLPVRLLPGIGPLTESRLKELNITVIREIAAMEPAHLALAFGRFGVLLHQRALGIDRTPVSPPRHVPALEEEALLPEDTNDDDVLRRHLLDVCERAAERLRARRLCAGKMELRIRYSDYREDESRLTLVPPVQTSAGLRERAGPALLRMLRRRTRVRSMYLRLTGFTPGQVQLDLFPEPKPERRMRLEQALDLLRQRYGKSVISSSPMQPAGVRGRSR